MMKPVVHENFEITSQYELKKVKYFIRNLLELKSPEENFANSRLVFKQVIEPVMS